jgi:hypothetical protein
MMPNMEEESGASDAVVVDSEDRDKKSRHLRE